MSYCSTNFDDYFNNASQISNSSLAYVNGIETPLVDYNKKSYSLKKSINKNNQKLKKTNMLFTSIERSINKLSSIMHSNENKQNENKQNESSSSMPSSTNASDSENNNTPVKKSTSKMYNFISTFKKSSKPKISNSKHQSSLESSSVDESVEDTNQSNFHYHIERLSISSDDTIKRQQLSTCESFPISIASNNGNKKEIKSFFDNSINSYSSSTSSSPVSPIKSNYLTRQKKINQEDIDGDVDDDFDCDDIRNEQQTYYPYSRRICNNKFKNKLVDRSAFLTSKVCMLSNTWSQDVSDYGEEDFMDAFRIFDTDGDGRITAKELMSVLTELGLKTSKSDIKKMIKELDKDNNGTIEYSEFVQMMTMPASKYDDEFELREAFKCIDLGSYFIKLFFRKLF
jgi:hypothetical protein